MQQIFGLFIGLLRLIGLIVSQIPGTKHLLKYLPWHHEEDFEPAAADAWKKGRIERREMLATYRSCPDYIERDRRDRLTIRQKSVEDQFVYTLIPYKQPSHITLTVKFL